MLAFVDFHTFASEEYKNSYIMQQPKPNFQAKTAIIHK